MCLMTNRYTLSSCDCSTVTIGKRNGGTARAAGSGGRGTTLVPLRVYFVHGLAKLELGLGRGKRQFEKRQAIAAREHQREMERELGRRR